VRSGPNPLIYLEYHFSLIACQVSAKIATALLAKIIEPARLQTGRSLLAGSLRLLLFSLNNFCKSFLGPAPSRCLKPHPENDEKAKAVAYSHHSLNDLQPFKEQIPAAGPEMR
jgi:hypothetical protein